MNLRSGTVKVARPPKTPKQKHVKVVASPTVPLKGRHQSYVADVSKDKLDKIVKKLKVEKPFKVKKNEICPPGKVNVSYCRPTTYKK